MKTKIIHMLVCILCFVLIFAHIHNLRTTEKKKPIQITFIDDETGEETDFLDLSEGPLHNISSNTIHVWSTELTKHVEQERGRVLAGPVAGQTKIEWLQQLSKEKIRPPDTEEIVGKSLRSNLRLCAQLIEKRGEWLMVLQEIISYACLGFLVLLLGPLLVWKKNQQNPDRNKKTVESIPFFVVSATGLLILISFLCTSLIDLQFIQLVLSSFGAPQIVINTDLIFYLKLHPDGLGQLMAFANHTAQMTAENPDTAFGMVQQFLQSLNQIQASPMFTWGIELVSWSGHLAALYAPLLASGSFFLLFGVIKPLLKESIAYPLQIAKGENNDGLWVFGTYFLTAVFREMRAFLWATLYLLFVLVLAVLLIHLLCFPIAVSFVDTFSGLIEYLSTNEQFPEISTFAYLLATAIFIGGGLTLLMFPLGTSIKNTYLIARIKIIEKKRFRDYPELMDFYRWLFGHNTPRILLSAGLSSGLVLLSKYVFPSFLTQLWWTSFCLGPLFIYFVWRGKAFPERDKLFGLEQKIKTEI